MKTSIRTRQAECELLVAKANAKLAKDRQIEGPKSPLLFTISQIAAALHVTRGRVTYILSTRPFIRPLHTTPRLHIYAKDALDLVRDELGLETGNEGRTPELEVVKAQPEPPKNPYKGGWVQGEEA